MAPTQTNANAIPASAAAASFAARTTRRRGSTISVGRIVPYRNSLVAARMPASVAKNTPMVTPELNRSRCASSGASRPRSRESASAETPSRLKAPAASSNSASVRVVRSLSSSETS